MDFVIAHPRSGTMFVSRLCETSRLGVSAHELLFALSWDSVSLPTEYYAGRAGAAEVELLLERYQRRPPWVRIDCNWKLTWILPVLLERFPDARVLHLLRDPRATVQSCCDLDYYGAVPVDAATDDEPTRRRNHWLRHMPRIRRDDWDSLSQYERNCAFWSETQRLALAAEGIGRRYLRVRVEDLAGDDGAARVLEHFDLEPPPVERLQALRAAGRINAKTHEKEQVRRRGSATEVAVAAREAAFERLCGDLTRSLGYL